VQGRLLSESGMQNHPLNPMTDPDIRRWLARQTKAPVGLTPWSVVRAGEAALRKALAYASERGETLVIVDAITDDDLVTIGKACRDAALLTGGSGIALGLPANFIAAGLASGSIPDFAGLPGPEAILAGSCSGATRQQVELHAKMHPSVEIDVERVMQGDLRAADLVAFIRANEGRAPLVYSSASPERVAALQQRYGREPIAEALDSLFAATAGGLAFAGLRRLVVAGGETSGAVVSALDLGALKIGPEIDPGVPVLAAEGDRPLALALKSGNFGAPDFFRKALDKLGGVA
jgi:uncharacterized protein YgbK (DUF1537 family)